MLLAMVACSPSGLFEKANWALGDVGWFIAILAVYRPVWETGVALALVAVANVGVAAARSATLCAVARMIGVLVAVDILQISAITMFRILNRNVDTGAAAIERLNQLEAERATRSALAQDRSAQYGRLNQHLLPLLRGLAAGELDPDDSAIQQHCEVAAGIVRTLITHDDGTATPASLDAVATLSEVAQRCGVTLDLHVDPNVEHLPDSVRDRLLSILAAALAAARPGEASVTLLGSESTATATVCLALAIPPERLRDRATADAAELATATNGAAEADLEQLDDDRAWLEVKWKR